MIKKNKKCANFDLALLGGFDLVPVGLWSFNKNHHDQTKNKTKIYIYTYDCTNDSTNAEFPNLRIHRQKSV